MFLQAVAQATQTPFEWVSNHLQVIGWPTVVLFAWRASRYLTKFEARAVAAENRLLVVADSNKELNENLKEQARAQEKHAIAIDQLAKAVQSQTQTHSEQTGLIHEMINEQKLLAQNQTTIMNGFQRVVEQLIDAVKEG